MKKVAFIGEGMCSWDGGLDFLVNIAKVINRYNEFQCILILPRYSSGMLLLRKMFRKNIVLEKERIDKAIETFSDRCPEIPIMFYTKIPQKLERYKGERLDRFCIRNGIDVVLPVLSNAFPKLRTPWIGYIPDLQEHYFPDFFSDKEINKRILVRQDQLNYSKYILVTSNTVKEDIYKFFPGRKSELFVTPFAPIAAKEYINTSNVDIEKYHLPEKYFIISNQFWMHKSHLTAFEALKALHQLTMYQNIHIVCTGKMDDYRNEDYCKSLLNKVCEMRMEEFIHFLGYIPKCDQIEIMKHSIALIQPTLLEGDPGGCSTYDAISIGVSCILSDIPVNKEAKRCKDVTYFKVQNYQSLKNEMVKVLEKREQNISTGFIEKRIEENTAILGGFYKSMLEVVINNY